MNYKGSYFNRLIPALIAVIILSGGAFGQVTPPSGIIGWYAGDGDTRDSSGNGNNATPASGISAPTYSVGEVGQDFNLNGAQYATIPDSATLRPQSFTIEGWGKLSSSVSSVNYRTFFAKPLGSGTSDSIQVYWIDENLHGLVCNNSGCLDISSSFSRGVWHHIAFSYDDPGGAATKTARLYIDGALRVSNSTGGAIGYDTNPAVIGADIENGSFNFGWSGGIDEVTLYNRALSLTEIQSINNAGINGKTKSAPTNAGANSQTQVGDAALTFDNVSTAGTTSDFTIDPMTAGTLPLDYVQTGLAYDISTTAVYSGNIQVCFNLPALIPRGINYIRIFHRENNSLIGRTVSTNPATNTVCANVSSLSPFVIATVQVAPSSGMIGWWAGDGDFRDSSGNGLDAAPAGGVNSPTFLIGKVGQGFSHVSVNGDFPLQYASIPDSAALRPQSVTIEGWGKLDNPSNVSITYFAKAFGTNNSDSYIVWFQSGALRAAICNSSGCFEIDDFTFTTLTWHHIAFTFDDPGGAAVKTARLYVDGVLKAGGTTGLAIGYDNHPVLIGADYDLEVIKFGWGGGIDDLALYSRALSASEILAISNAGVNGKNKQAATNAGTNVSTVVNDATITFPNVSTAGTTTDYTIDPTIVDPLPPGYTHTGLVYQISTTAVYSGLITECFHIPAITDATVFGKLKVLHSEGGTLVDKTISNDFAARLVCGQTTSLSPFVIANGLSPTAASVSIGGRVTAGKSGLARARVTLIDMNGETRFAATNPFGYFHFDDVAAGETYILSVSHKSYNFAPQVIGVVEAVSEINFTTDKR